MLSFSSNSKRNKWVYTTPKNFCLAKEAINEMDRQPVKEIQI